MNLVLDEAFEEKAGGEKVAIGMVVGFLFLFFFFSHLQSVGGLVLMNGVLQVIRGNSVVMLEALERISEK